VYELNDDNDELRYKLLKK